MINIFKIILFLLISTLIILGVAFYYYQKGINTSLDIGDEKKFIITPGESTDQIGNDLFRDGFINSTLAFKVYLMQNGWEGKFKAGEYKLGGSMTMRQVVNAIITGRAINKDIKILIKEGLNTGDVAKILEQNNFFPADDFLKVAGYPKIDYRASVNYPPLNDFSPKFNFLNDKPKYVGLEGYLFPDTYLFFKDSTPEGIVLKMLENFDRKLSPQMRQDIKKQEKTVYEIVTMASLVEKEVRTKDDMKIVSGIFWKRIQNSQRLESCASLAYILGVNKAQYTKEDTLIDSPYNTYRNDGLPPGPIANPGENALIAAIYPTATDYNYFLTANDGHTVFSKTFDEHIRNKQLISN
jgi:UPF0755 protein